MPPTIETPQLLISDDDRDFRETLRAVFQPRGFGTLLAADGEEAVEIVRRETVHVVLIDLHMPKLSGLEAIAQIKRIQAAVPCILISAAVEEQVPLKKEEPVASFSQQIAAERQSLDRSYSLTPHLPNYLLAYSLRNDPNRPEVTGEEGRLQKQEAVLQISVKFPLWRRMLGTENDLLFGYTSKSWFQAYNSALSKPFRETNYEPEIFWRHYGGPRLPLGVQIIGPHFGEAALLSLAARFQTETDWHQMTPAGLA